MASCDVIIKDEVNVKINRLELTTRRKLVNKFKYEIPGARFMPAVRLGRWDGCVSYFSMGGQTYVNMLDEILPIIEAEGYYINLEDNRPPLNLQFKEIDQNYLADKNWPTGHPAQGQPIILRDYQIEVINKFLHAPQSIQEIATGAGKTIITATLSKLCEPYGRTVVIVPNKSLVTQTEEDYKNIGVDVGVYYGDRKQLNRTHTICTWQSLNNLMKASKDGVATTTMTEFAESVACVMVDEVHMAKADVLKQLLSGPFAHCSIRWGLTGTVPKEEYNQKALSVSIGQVAHRISASELQDKGILANCHVNIIQTEDFVAYKTYQEEQKYLTTTKTRMGFVANEIRDIASSGNTLVLVNLIKTGELLEELITDSVFVSGKTKVQDRKDEYDEIKTASNKIIIATYGVAAVGINIPRIFNLVLIEPGKSFVRVIQSIGRGIRKAQDKDHVQIWDITSTAKFAKRHLAARKKFYKEANYPYTITKKEN
jgi:superfamily II DNA or RNA helicase